MLQQLSFQITWVTATIIFMETYFLKLEEKELLKDQLIDITQGIYLTISVHR